jgi:ATP-dependent Clp protease ATP-binding subunit ClpA
MFEHFTPSILSAVVAAMEEARRQGARTIGTEHLLQGLLSADDGHLADALGLDAASCRAALDAMDAEALAAVGVDVADFGELRSPEVRGHLPLTSGAKAVLAQTLQETRAAKQRSIAADHLLLALLRRPRPDPVAELLVRAAVEPEVVRARLSSAA